MDETMSRAPPESPSEIVFIFSGFIRVRPARGDAVLDGLHLGVLEPEHLGDPPPPLTGSDYGLHGGPPALVPASEDGVHESRREFFQAASLINAARMNPARRDNPWSDRGSREALRIGGANLVAAVEGSESARDQLAWAATLAGVAFGNAGVHIPHAMAYAVAGLVRDFKMKGYPQEEALVPHGVSVVVNAASAFRFTAETSPERHLEAAKLLGGDGPLANVLEDLIAKTNVPRDLTALGYDARDVPTLVRGAFAQQRLLSNAPRAVSESDLAALFLEGMR